MFDILLHVGSGYVIEGGQRVISSEAFRATPIHFDGYTQRYTFVRNGVNCSVHRTYVTVCHSI